jgi:phenylpropionate dioxygenase-like ring-hydroxylating dioxygenase large terminal subunit
MDIDRKLGAAARDITRPIPFGWYVAGYSEDLAVGGVTPLRYFDRELVLWRGEDGRPRMLDAYCRHLGAHLGHGGRVEGNSVVCPFHAWAYDDRGIVVDIPYSKSIPPQVKRPCLRTWPITERNGLIWVWYHPQGDAPHWEVADVTEATDPEWTACGRFEWHINVHLQDMAENGSDTAHFQYTHGTASFPDQKSVFDGHVMRTGINAPMDTPRGQVPGAIDVVNVGPGQSWTRFTGISETLLISGVTPVAIDHVHVRFGFYQPKSQAEGPQAAVAAAIVREVVRQLEQDKRIWDNKAFVERPILCQGDGEIDRWRRFYSQFYAADADASAATVSAAEPVS